MKKLVWVAGFVLALSIFYPNGITLPTRPNPAPVPAPVDVPVSDAIVAALRSAPAADKARVRDVYSAMATVLQRDSGQRIKTTEQWADYQANTLQLAIDTPGKYPGLDVAIEQVFLQQTGTDDVLPANPETRAQLLKACQIVAASAK
jgi:hypothetical protein